MKNVWRLPYVSAPFCLVCLRAVERISTSNCRIVRINAQQSISPMQHHQSGYMSQYKPSLLNTLCYNTQPKGVIYCLPQEDSTWN